MLTPELLAILCCPETHQELRLADRKQVEQLNAEITLGVVRNRAGEPVSEAIETALVRSDGQVAYPVRNGIPVLLVSEALPLRAQAEVR